MKKLIENFINGNLTDAKEQAQRHSWKKIFQALRDDYGYSEAKAIATADYLKGEGSFQRACDAV